MRRAILAAIMVCVGMGQACAAQETGSAVRKPTNIPAQNLGAALQTLAEDRNIQVVYFSRNVDRVRTRGARGELTTDEALIKVLSGTGFTYRYLDQNTVTIVPIAAEPEGAPDKTASVSGLLQLAQANKEGSVSPQTAGDEADRSASGEESGVMTVTGSRLRSVVGEAGVNPVVTFTRKDIERIGVSTLGELRWYIPQIQTTDPGNAANNPYLGTGFTTHNATSTPAETSRVSMNLRGITGNATLILVNGRRVAKSGQSRGNDDYDLAGIPLSAVERIEVLTDGASAVYGSDALAGVVNIILRKDYSGTEATLTYDNTFESDVAIKNVTLTHGFRSGKFSAFVSASWEENNPLNATERWFTATDDRRPYGGSDARSTIPGGSGRIRTVTNNGILPGLGVTEVAIPAGSQGQNLTLQDFQSAGSPAEGLNTSAEGYRNLMNPRNSRNVAARFNYDWRPWMHFFGDARWNRARNYLYGPPPASTSLTLPVGAPENPFGVAIRAHKFFFDLGPSLTIAEVSNPGVTIGVRGELSRGWYYESTVSWAGGRPKSHQVLPSTFDNTALNAALAGSGPNRPIVLYDSTAGNPNPPGLLESFLAYDPLSETADTWTYEMHGAGPIWRLPAGEVQLAVGVELREEDVKFYRDPNSLLFASSVTDPVDRSVNAVFAELSVPIFSPEQKLKFLNRLEMQVAARRDDYSDFGAAIKPRHGVLYRPFSWLMLRATRSEGFKVPTLVQVYAPVRDVTINFTAATNLRDPLRNDELVLGLITQTAGGNPDLGPETSVSKNFGVAIEVPFFEGLSFGVDHYDLDYRDRIGGISNQERILHFPERFTREETTDGTVGRVIGVDARSHNIALLRTRGYDYHATYHRMFDFGELTMRALASRPTEYFVQATQQSTPTRSLTQRPARGSGSIFLSRHGWDLGLTGVYQDRFQNTPNLPMYPATLEWHLNASYDFTRGQALTGRSGWLAWLFSDSRVSLTIFNLFDTRPIPIDGEAWYNSAIDPRMRRYSLSFRRTF